MGRGMGAVTPLLKRIQLLLQAIYCVGQLEALAGGTASWHIVESPEGAGSLSPWGVGRGPVGESVSSDGQRRAQWTGTK
jgi:hypothetical protein